MLLFLLSLSIKIQGQDNSCSTGVRTDYPEQNVVFIEDDPARTITIPVIFHVLYRYEYQNVHECLILDALETLNLDFLALNKDLDLVRAYPVFDTLIGTPNINFVLAQELPNGTNTDGIIRKKTDISLFKVKKKKTRRKVFYESPIINSRKYLNVYICNTDTNAYVPLENNTKHDGIVIDYTRFHIKGSRTLTHESGHWLDLRHIFKGGCKDLDKVDDTPAQLKHNHKCPEYPVKECDNSSVMYMNFMDYSSCRFFFTKGQVAKMRNYILKFKDFD